MNEIIKRGNLICNIIFLLFAGIVQAQSNFIPDPSVEAGSISGANNDYYNFNNEVLWRAWPFIGFEPDTGVKNSGERSLKIVFRDYGSDNFQPTFRCESFPKVENATYQFSFYYKTDVDRSSEKFIIKINEGTALSGSVEFFSQEIAIDPLAKDGFVQAKIEFSTGKDMDGILPFITVPFISEGAYMHFDDASLVKVVDTPNSWGPSPENESTNVPTSVSLSWQSGLGAIKHNVYFGTNENDLQSVLTETVDNQYHPTTLVNETTYYWKVDEIDADDKITTGDIWSFKTKTYQEEFNDQVKTQRISSSEKVTWEQFGPGNSGFVNFVRYHPTLPNVCLTSPDMGNTYQTEDNGKSWYTVKDVDGQGEFFRLYDAYYSTKTAKFGIAIESSRLWMSQDTGRSWTNIKNCPWYDNDGEGNDTRSWYRKVSAIAIDPADDNTWYVGAGNHSRGQQHLWGSINTANRDNPRGRDSDYMGTIWKTTDAGKSWTALSTGIHEKAQFTRIVVHPTNSNIIFAGSQYGLFKSTDGGTSWTDIGSNGLDNNTIMNMDYYYNSNSGKFVLYVADQVRYYPDGSSTSNSGGIFKSEDEGNSWSNANGNLYLNLTQLSGGVPDNYYQYIGRWFGITQAEAKSQYPTLPTNALQYFNSLNVDQSKENSIYVGFYDAQIQYSITPGRLWKTSDDGENWLNIARDFETAWNADKTYWDSRNNPVSDNMQMGHAPYTQQWGNNYPLRSLRYADVNSKGEVMLLYAHNTLVSTDRGNSFTQVDETYTANGNIMGNGNSNLPGQCLYLDRRLGEGIAFFGSGEHNLWKTTNDGENGKQAAKYLNASQESVFAIVTHPWDKNTVYTTSMRQHALDRIYKSTDGGESFVDWGKATNAEEWMKTNHLRIDPVNPDYMYLGVTEVAGSGGGSGTDGPDKDKEGGFHISTDGGKNFVPSNNGMPSKVWVRDIEFDPRDDTKKSLFVAAPWNREVQSNGGLFHSTDRGMNWTEITVSDKIEGVNNVQFDHTGRMYATGGRRAASLDAGGLFYSDDYGQTWTQIFDAPFVDNFDVSPFDHNLLVVTNSQLTTNPGAFISTDRGNTWTKYNDNIGQPQAISQVEFDLHDSHLIWMSVIGSGFYKGRFEEAKAVRKLKVSQGDVTLDFSQQHQINVEKIDYDGDLLFKSENSSVATVSSSGEISTTGGGATKIWVTTEDGRYSDFVYVVVKSVAVTGIFIDSDNFTLDLDSQESKQLQATVTPADASNQSITWESINEAIVTITESGMVESVGVGQTKISASSVDGNFKDEITVTVTSAENPLNSADEIQVSLYPTPVEEELNITGIEGHYSMSIYSINGRLIKTYNQQGNSSLRLGNLNKGMYLYKLKTADSEYTGKLIKD